MRSNDYGISDAGPALAATARKRVLLVDDDPDQHQTCGVLLAHLGYEVISAYQGDEGFQAARAHRPHVILLDLHMPTVGGDTVARALADDPATEAIPIIVVTADVFARGRMDDPPLSIRDWLVKPCVPAVVAAAVAGVIGEPG